MRHGARTMAATSLAVLALFFAAPGASALPIDGPLDTVDDVADDVTGSAQDVVDGAGDTVGDAVEGAGSAVDDAVDNATNQVDEATGGNVGQVVDDVVPSTDDVKDAVGDVAETVGNTVDSVTGGNGTGKDLKGAVDGLLGGQSGQPGSRSPHDGQTDGFSAGGGSLSTTGRNRDGSGSTNTSSSTTSIGSQSGSFDPITGGVVEGSSDGSTQPGTEVRSGGIAEQVGRALTEAARRFAFPLILALALGSFLALQHRLDSRDPKLATAPLEADSRMVNF